MDRRNFFKKIGITSLGVIVAPTVVVEIVKNIPKPGRILYGVIVPKCRRAGSNLFINYDLVNPEFISKLYRRYGNQKMNYFELLKSLHTNEKKKFF